MSQDTHQELEQLNDFRLKIIRLLMEDTVIKKDTYSIKEKTVDGEIQKQREYNGHRGIECAVSDWKKADKLYRGNSARERIRLILQEVRKIAKEGRKRSLEMDKTANKNKQMDS